MKKINIKCLFVLTIIMILVIGSYFGLYTYSHETLSRMDYTLRGNQVLLKTLETISLFIPILIILLYVVFRKRLNDKLNTSNMFYTIITFSTVYIIIETLSNIVIFLLMKNSVIGYCNMNLEPIPMGAFGACFLPGLEYSIMMIYLSIPLAIIIIFETLFFLHKKIFKIDKIKFKDIIMVIIYFIIICLTIWFIVYATSFI